MVATPMKKELFNGLVASIKEAGKIHRGEMRASRELAFDPEDIRRGSQRPANRRHERRVRPNAAQASESGGNSGSLFSILA